MKLRCLQDTYLDGTYRRGPWIKEGMDDEGKTIDVTVPGDTVVVPDDFVVNPEVFEVIEGPAKKPARASAATAAGS